MFTPRRALVTFAAFLVLILAACSGIPTPLPPTLPVSPLASPTGAAGAPAPQESPLATATQAASALEVTPSPGRSAMTGRLVDVRTGRPITNQNLSLPTVICPEGVAEEDKQNQCVYAVDEAFDPSTLSDEDGRFAFLDITPGDYVLIVGNPATKYTLLSDETNQALVWTAEADKVLAIGDLLVELP
jgi:hypothetical protein